MSPATTRRPTARRQCRGSVSGRSTPGEVTSSVYGLSPVASLLSRASDTTRETAAIASMSTPPSRSTMTRITLRRPAALTATSSRSKPAAVTTGSSAARTRSRETAAITHLPLLFCRPVSVACSVGAAVLRASSTSRVDDRLAPVTDLEPRLTRRALLGAGVLVLAGCKTRAHSSSSDPDAAALAAARAGEVALLSSYAEGTPEHSAHLTHLRALGGAAPSPGSTPNQTTSTAPAYTEVGASVAVLQTAATRARAGA